MDQYLKVWKVGVGAGGGEFRFLMEGMFKRNQMFGDLFQKVQGGSQGKISGLYIVFMFKEQKEKLV